MSPYTRTTFEWGGQTKRGIKRNPFKGKSFAENEMLRPGGLEGKGISVRKHEASSSAAFYKQEKAIRKIRK